MKRARPVVLTILDGFGYSKNKKYNAIAHANISFMKYLLNQYPHAILQAAGKSVGLPDGFCGNSEVGHLTIGAGRIIQQPMKLWLEKIEDGLLDHNQVMIAGFEHLRHVQGTLHIMGLLSDAGVHAHEKQMYALIDAAIKLKIKKIVVHPFLDGRDVSPQSAYIYLHRLFERVKHYNSHVVVGSIHGRFYAMDRSNNWDRIEKSYRVLTEKQDTYNHSWEEMLEHNYAQGITDEFVLPLQLNSTSYIHNGDGILFYNIRPDRARQLAAAFVQNHFSHFITKPLNLTFFMTPVSYDAHLPTTVLFPREVINNTLKDVLAVHNKTIFTIAETEKYAHVTYFFRGENEEAVRTETRIMIDSIPAHNYKNIPQMSANAITDAVIDSLRYDVHDFYLINYANADMVGHSGDFDATVKAVGFLDVQLKRLYDVVVQKMDGTLYIIGDHGKAEDMYDEIAQQSMTAHTGNPVPFIMVKKGLENSRDNLPLTQLSQVAPFILYNMNIPVPNEMQSDHLIF